MGSHHPRSSARGHACRRAARHRCRSRLFRRVIDNLLENSHNYTPDRDSPIELAAARVGDSVAFQIRDKGVGLSADELPHVFDPFWRSERSRSRATGGVGLGLTLAKRIVDAHGGEINVASEVGVGTVVRITVPIAKR